MALIFISIVDILIEEAEKLEKSGDKSSDSRENSSELEKNQVYQQ